MKYQVEVTINLPDGKEVYQTYLDVAWHRIIMMIETDYPTMTSFMMVCVPIAADGPALGPGHRLPETMRRK